MTPKAIHLAPRPRLGATGLQQAYAIAYCGRQVRRVWTTDDAVAATCPGCEKALDARVAATVAATEAA